MINVGSEHRNEHHYAPSASALTASSGKPIADPGPRWDCQSRLRCTRRRTVVMLATYLPTRRKGDKACRAQAARHISRVRRGPGDECSDDDTVIGPSSSSPSSAASFLQRGWQPPGYPPPASAVPENGLQKKVTSVLPRPLVSSRRRMDSLLPGGRGVSSRRVNGRYRLRKAFALNDSFVFCVGHVRRLRPGIICSLCCPVSVPVPWRRTLNSKSQVLLHIGNARVSHGAFQ